MEELIKKLSQFPHRLSGSAPNLSAAQTIRFIFESFGFQTKGDSFRVPGLFVQAIALNILALLSVFIFLKNYPLSLILYGIFLLSFWGELSISFHFLRRMLPSHKACNVETCVTEEKQAAKTIVVVAHYDTPPTGFLYNSGLADRISRQLSKMPSPLNRFFLPPLVAAVFLGGALAIRPVAALSLLYAVLSVLSILILCVMLLNVVQIGLSRPSPGANDNGSGLLVLLELARRFGATKPHRNTLHLLASGAEEAGFFGVKAFIRSHKELDRESTLFINLESIGGGELHWVTSEGCLQGIATPEAGLALLDDLEKKNVIPVFPRSPILSPTDSTALGKNGYNFVTLIALKDKSAPINYHRVTDTFDKLDIPTLTTAADVVDKMIRYYCG